MSSFAAVAPLIGNNSQSLTSHSESKCFKHNAGKCHDNLVLSLLCTSFALHSCSPFTFGAAAFPTSSTFTYTHTHELLSMLTRDFILKNDLCTIAEVECGNDGCDFVMAVLILFM
jgi:hypothetical protein